MTSIFPTSSERSPDAELQVVGLDEEAGSDLLAALSSETARDVLLALEEEPMPPSEVADRVDTSVQNVHYHLENLEEAGAVEGIDTEYSEKGREMTVYAPSGQPLVIVSGSESAEVETALRDLLGGLVALAVASYVVQLVSPDVPTREEIVGAAGTPSMPVPPGVTFFAGGALVLLGVFLFWYLG